MFDFAPALWNYQSPALVPAVASWGPTSFGANLALDFTNLAMANLYSDTGATTNITGDLQTVKAIKDPTTGIIATNATGWVYHANAGKPFLQMDGTSSFTTTTNVTYRDGTGQWSGWVTASFDKNALNDILHASGSTLINASPQINSSATFAGATGGSYSDSMTGPALNTAAVIAGIVTTANVETFVNNVGNGPTAFTDTLHTGAAQIIIGNGASGPFYGAMFAKGDQTANRANAQGYMGALH